MTISMRAYSASKQSKAGTRSSAFPAPLLQSQQARQQDADHPIPYITGLKIGPCPLLCTLIASYE